MRNLVEEIEVIKNSTLFNSEWYSREYPDVNLLNMDPAEHFVKVGAGLGRNPSVDFDTQFYLKKNGDVKRAGINPLYHYVIYGQKEGRARARVQLKSKDYNLCVDVVVPVYNALEDVQKCLESLRRCNDGFFLNCIIVNDASDVSTTQWLRDFAAQYSGFQLIEHATNLGYTKSVNDGIGCSRAPYVVTLNSDTIVTPGWLTGLIRCVQSSPKIGIVGPLSNAASWQNIPYLYDENSQFAVNDIPDGYSLNSFSQLVTNVSSRSYPKVFFVNGFCFLIKRDVIDKIGLMDEESFPLGYGEENDYCVRAIKEGFELAIADDVYVYHAKSKSFGHSKRKELSKRGSIKIKEKHGDKFFEELVAKQKSVKQLNNVREKIQLYLKINPTKQRNFHLPQTSIGDFSVLFLLPVRGDGGGVHSIIQEVSAMRRIGVNAKVAIQDLDANSYYEKYSDIDGCQDIFRPFNEKTLLQISSDYDVVVATIFSSVVLVKSIVDKYPAIMPAYYIQDYEPYFFKSDQPNFKIAYDSYKLLSGAVLFAKTDWIIGKVWEEHAVHVHKVSPSIDHDVYHPISRPKSSTFNIIAMVRPQSPRRGAERTMELFFELYQKFGSMLSFTIFGCSDDEKGFAKCNRDFPYKNLGILKRREVAKALAASDIFVDLSDYQAFGRTALEAMACGCLAVVPLNGGANEYAQDRVNSIVVDSFSLDECKRAISEVIQDGNVLESLRLNALQTASLYSVHRAAVSELCIFSHALSEYRSTKLLAAKCEQ